MKCQTVRKDYGKNNPFALMQEGGEHALLSEAKGRRMPLSGPVSDLEHVSESYRLEERSPARLVVQPELRQKSTH